MSLIQIFNLKSLFSVYLHLKLPPNVACHPGQYDPLPWHKTSASCREASPVNTHLLPNTIASSTWFPAPR